MKEESCGQPQRTKNTQGKTPLLAKDARNGAPIDRQGNYGVILKTTPFRLSMFVPPFEVVP